MFYNKEQSPSVRFFGGGGAPKIKAPEPPAKTEEVRRIDEGAGEERKEAKKRVPPGRKDTLKYGIEKVLTERLGL